MPALAELGALVAPGSLLTSEADLAVYSYDGVLTKVRPDGVLIARSAKDVQKAVEWCAKTGTPFIARGAGTNLSGGCVPLQGGIVIALARLNKILSVDVANRVACVEPGVVNLELQKEAEKVGLFYAPDPASFKVSTIGGNSAENSGGPRCLKYGVTTNHVLAVEAVMPDGSIQRFSQDDDGPEFMSLLIGAEGTLGVIIRIWTKLTPLPQEIRTMLAGFPSIDAAVKAVSALIASGVLPRCLEAMDAPTVASVQAIKPVGYPLDPAVLLIELDGDKSHVDKDAIVVEKICKEHGASGVRSAADAAERERLWEARRGAYAALSRLAPNVLVEDGVVPRDKLPAVVKRIQEIAKKYGVKAYLLFHAGDGNIHPNIAFDERDKEETARVTAAGHEMLQACVELGGSLSGEHGIGLDKRDAMAWLFSPATLMLFRRVKQSIDPKGIANPDKLFPLTDDKKEGPGYVRPPSAPLGEHARLLVDKMNDAAGRQQKVRIRGASTRLPDATPSGAMELLTTGMNRILDWDKSNFTVTVEGGMSVHELHRELNQAGFHIRLPKTGGTVGGLLATRPSPLVREDLLGMRLLLADGQVVELGGKVVKNVAGYDLARVVLGSWGKMGLILDVTYKLYANPQDVPRDVPVHKPAALGPWADRVRAAFDPESALL